jgi:hypothetical protein
MSIWSDLVGTTKSYFKLGLAGVRLKNDSGNLAVRNNADGADAEITVSTINVSGNGLTLNSDGISGADRKYIIQRPVSGMGGDVTLTLPADDGTPGQVLITDGSGVLSFGAASNTALCDKVDTTSLAFGASSPVAMFSTGILDVINMVEVIVDTPFNGSAPAMSIGVAGTVSKYMAAAEVDLKTAGVYQVHPGLVAGGVEALIATYSADSSSAGEARVQVYYATPA